MDYRLGIVAALMEPSLRLASVLKLPLDDIELLARSTYVRVARERGWSVREAARRLGKSKTTISEIIAAARGRSLPDQMGDAFHRQRCLVDLAGRGPFTLAEAADALPGVSRSAVAASVDDLVDEGLLERTADGARLAKGVFDYVDMDDATRRIAGLRQVLDAVLEAVYQRFFGPTPDGTLAHVEQFDAPSREELKSLASETKLRLDPRLRDADGAAKANGKTRVTATAVLLFVERPTDALWGARRGRRQR